MPNATGVKNEFVQYLLDQGIVRQDQLDGALKLAQSQGIALEEALARAKVLSEEGVAQHKAKFFGFPYVDLGKEPLAPEILQQIPKEVAANYKVIAYSREADTLHVALVDPRNFQAMAALDVLASQADVRIKYAVTSPASFAHALEKYGMLKTEVAEVVEIARHEVAPEEKKREPAEEVGEVIKGAPVSRIVAVIMRHAYEGHASDIHIEPHRAETRVRYRVDGNLQTTLTLPEDLHAAVVARVKVLANLKLDETRIPQDGRITESIGGKPIDFRVSILPLQEAKEKVVMRILSTERAPGLEELGFNAEHIKIIKENIRKPHGLFLISGPTGSGKSTTLYTVLTMLNQEGINIVTLEDPIEYVIEGVNQSQIRPEVSYNFATGLRAILRQDPNIIMVGEIRDSETAELAVHAALTGHLLLSTIHTNDAVGVVPRLTDLQVEQFLLAATFNVAIAQRLARKICADCKGQIDIPDKISGRLREELNGIPKRYLPPDLRLEAPLTFYAGQGCVKCGTSGYKGRVAVSEIVQGTPQLQKIIAEGFASDPLAAELARQETITMKQDALLKALAGLTTVEEVLRISKE